MNTLQEKITLPSDDEMGNVNPCSSIQVKKQRVSPIMVTIAELAGFRQEIL